MLCGYWTKVRGGYDFHMENKNVTYYMRGGKRGVYSIFRDPNPLNTDPDSNLCFRLIRDGREYVARMDNQWDVRYPRNVKKKDAFVSHIRYMEEKYYGS